MVGKIHKVNIHSLLMLLFLFTNIYIHIQQPSLRPRNIFIHIQRAIFVHIHDRNIYSTFSAHHLCALLLMMHKGGAEVQTPAL